MLTEDEENGKHQASLNHVNYTLWMTCFQVSLFLMQVCLVVYLCQFKSEVHREYLKEIRSEIWRNEIREILKDPRHCELLSTCFIKRDSDRSRDYLLDYDYISQELEDYKNELVSFITPIISNLL